MIHVEGIGKRYRLGESIRHDTLRDFITHGLFRRSRDENNRADNKNFWALRDVSFEVSEGEVIGIIGRNGAGKSTLLKILARITPPTHGRVVLRGRVASLLEVGTGFHPELSGRENIFMNGAILGMTRREIQSQFDEIVAFAEVDRFLDTPIKRYSSGMYVRLAFAVAAHLHPEILLVDEVLAVGDNEFQNKCLNRMSEVARSGRTVLLVSHNMGTIQQVTTRSLWLANGNLVKDAETPTVVADYLATGDQQAVARELTTLHPEFVIRSVRFDHEGQQPGFNRPMRFELETALGRTFKSVAFEIGVCNSVGARILTSRHVEDTVPEGKSTLSICIPDHHLAPGHYSLTVGIARATQQIYYAENVLGFSLSDLGVHDSGIQPYLAQQRDRIGAFIAGRWEKV